MPMDVANLWHLRRNSLSKKRQRAQPLNGYRRRCPGSSTSRCHPLPDHGCIFIVDLPRAFSLPDASVNQGVAQAG